MAISDPAITSADSVQQQPVIRPLGRIRLVLTLGFIVALGPLTIDMYLPALPTITTDLAASETAIQFTLTGTFAGLALGQLLVGPLSDTVGRRLPLIAGAGLHVLASVLCAVSPNVETLSVFRILQGVGAAAGSVVALAIVRDLYVGRAAATLLSRLMLVIGVAPVFAPTVGGALLVVLPWQGVFGVLAVLGVALMLLVSFTLPETLPKAGRRPFGLGQIARTAGQLVRDRIFVGLTLVAGLAMTGVFGYVAGASFVFQEQFGVSSQTFGLLFGVGGILLVVATQLNPVLLKRWEPEQVLTAGAVLAALSGVALLLTATLSLGGLVGILVPVWAALFSASLALPNAPALALSRHGEAAGTAAALLGAVQFGIGAIAAPLVGALGTDAVAMAVVMSAGLALSLITLLAVVRPWQPGVQATSTEPVVVVH
ncbi:multidrug effflux MFS transporter [Kribbella sp. NPDC051770]|uniref:multidrug effflux MFS transporter n=1 Tax=Kribbella sp. NPDC051770 TaxID=3155413 RepID=UPI003419F3A2